MADIKLQPDSAVSVMTTALNSLANASGVLGDVAVANNTNLNMWGIFQLAVTFGTNPTLNNPIELYLIPAVDGTNYADTVDGATPFVPYTSFIGAFNVRATTSAQRLSLLGPYGQMIALPPVPFKLYLVNRSGQAFPASGSIVSLVPYRAQN